jgi:hypothetical protein
MSNEPKSGELNYPRSEAYGPLTIAHHALGAALNAALIIASLVWLGSHTASLRHSAWALLFGTLAGLWVADAISGVLHWTFDTWFAERNQFVQRMVFMVREHHLVPQAMFRYPFYHDAGTLSWIMCIVLGPPMILRMLSADDPSPLAYGAMWMTDVANVCVVFMLEFHKCGHRPPAHGALGILQRVGLVLRPRHHARHHRAPYTVKYCTVNGWANYVLDGVGFFRALEWLINKLTGAVPRQDDRAWMAKYQPARAAEGVGSRGAGRHP